MTPRITQSDVARRAGVHNTTVSLALRNNPSIPLATRKRIQALAEQMGYRPDPALQALMAYRTSQLPRRQTSTLAYLTNCAGELTWRASQAHAQFYAGAARRALELGFQLEHFWIGAPGMNDRRLSDIFFHRRISGLVFGSDFSGDNRTLDFDWSQFSAVRIDCCGTRPALHYVTNDQRAIIRLAMQRVIAAGYRRIGFAIPPSWDDLVDRAWSAGFLAEQASLKVADRVPIHDATDTTPGLSSRGPIDPAAAHRSFAKWYVRYRPDVIIGYAPCVRPYLAKLAVRVPEDVAFADIFLEEADGQVAGVWEHCERVGEVAVELLAGQLQQGMRGVPTVPIATLVQGTWIDGATLPPQ